MAGVYGYFTASVLHHFILLYACFVWGSGVIYRQWGNIWVRGAWCGVSCGRRVRLLTAGYVGHPQWNEMNFGFHPDRDDRWVPSQPCGRTCYPIIHVFVPSSVLSYTCSCHLLCIYAIVYAFVRSCVYPCYRKLRIRAIFCVVVYAFVPSSVYPCYLIRVRAIVCVSM